MESADHVAQNHPVTPDEPRSPRVSVIIPCYNTARFVAEAVESVFSQTYRDYEVVVVNDGSPDTPALEQVLAPWRDKITYIHTENCGLAGARNNGIRASRGKLIALLDSDDIWEPTFLQVLVGLLEENPGIDVAYSDAVLFGLTDSPGQTLMNMFPPQEEITFESILCSRAWVFVVSCIVRREILVRVGGFDQDLRYAEDLDLWLRIAHGGCKFLPCSQPLVRYRKRAGSLTAECSPDQEIRRRIQLYEKLSGKLDLTPEQKHAVELVVQRKRAEITGLKPAIREFAWWVKASIKQINS
jgi:glycosyltransferase involved in cell wall biosynthesis